MLKAYVASVDCCAFSHSSTLLTLYVSPALDDIVPCVYIELSVLIFKSKNIY